MNQGARNGAAKVRPAQESPIHPIAECCAISFIRTMTVGSGFAPDLLTLANTQARQALAGCCQNHVYQFCQIPPVGNFTPP